MSVPVDHGLTDMQSSFVSYVASGVDPTLAAKLAGYENESALAGQLLRKPHVLAAIHLETARNIGAAAPIALKVLIDIVQDETAPKGVRVDAADKILNRAGHVGPRARDAEPAARDLTEMTADELMEVVGKLRARDARLGRVGQCG